MSNSEQTFHQLEPNFKHWEIIKDCIDEYLDLILNYRQSGHPGGSRSKVHAFVVATLSGFMRWDIRHPEKAFGDRFILAAGHTVPLVYTTLAVYNDALRFMLKKTGDQRYAVPNAEERQLVPEDLIGFRNNGGLAGHAEQEGKTLFLKFNTGPSGHGLAATVGEALALKRLGAGEVKVISIEGEGGLTPGASHEAKNTAYGLGLDNLYYFVDWNDFGIDDNPISRVVAGTPEDWFKPYGWNVRGNDRGSEWGPVTKALLDLWLEPETKGRPNMVFNKTRKGRGYGKFDNKSHGAPHKLNSDLFWQNRKSFMEKYGVQYIGVDQGAPDGKDALKEQFAANVKVVSDFLHSQTDTAEYLANRLVELGDSVPQEISTLKIKRDSNPCSDPIFTDVENLPEELFAKPGEKQPNRAAYAKWGAWVNGYCRTKYGRPLFLASSADLADSTNISGFAKEWNDFPGYGWYLPGENEDGVLLPQMITEFVNSGLTVGTACVNIAKNPLDEFQGFYATCSTYGSFSYLKYGMMRLFSQLAQDSQIKTGKVIWVAGHSGPETAEDSRTHFGIFSPGVTQLFPDGQVIDLHPWEYNDVAPALAGALASGKPIIALHLTRPGVTIPDRVALGMDPAKYAARGAYLIRDYKPGQPKQGTFIVQGTCATESVVKLLPKLDELNLNVKLVQAVSPQLFLEQDAAYQNRVIDEYDRINSTVISNRARRVMVDWYFNSEAANYAVTPDHDNRWRTGGSLEEIVAESHLSPDWVLKGIMRFIEEKSGRIERLKRSLEVFA